MVCAPIVLLSRGLESDGQDALQTGVTIRTEESL